MLTVYPPTEVMLSVFSCSIASLLAKKEGKVADFNKLCGTTPPLDPKKKEDEARWEGDCRNISRNLSAQFLQDLLTQAPWQKAVPFELLP